MERMPGFGPNGTKPGVACVGRGSVGGIESSPEFSCPCGSEAQSGGQVHAAAHSATSSVHHSRFENASDGVRDSFVITCFCTVLGSYAKAVRYYTGEQWSTAEAGLNDAL
jgi:hypothetical protein